MSIRIANDEGVATSRIPIETRVISALAAAMLGWVVFRGSVEDLSISPLAWMLTIGLIGLPHGACDALLAQRAGWWATWPKALAFHIGYVGLAATTWLAWHADPTLALACFLSLSAWHFSFDWSRRADGITRALLGAGLITWPAVFHPETVAVMFGHLGLSHPQQLVPLLAGIGIVAAAGLLFLLPRSNHLIQLEGAALFCLALLLSPAMYFLFYFCGLHSIRHFRDELEADRNSNSSTFLRWFVIFVYTAIPITLGLMWVVEAVPGGVTVTAATHQAVFVGLSCLTTPHLILALMARQRAEAGR